MPELKEDSMLVIGGHENRLYNKNSKTIHDEKEKEIFIKFVRLIGGRYVDIARPLCIDPYFGSYGLTGFVFTIQGTPTHGMAIVDLERGVLYKIDCYTFFKRAKNRRYDRDSDFEVFELLENILKIASFKEYDPDETIYKYRKGDEPEHAIIGLPELRSIKSKKQGE